MLENSSSNGLSSCFSDPGTVVSGKGSLIGKPRLAWAWPDQHETEVKSR
jgi:hypothetical protein